MKYVSEIQSRLMRVSWECVRESFQPRPVPRETLARSLALAKTTEPGKEALAMDQARDEISELETKLRLLQAVEGSGTEVKVALDPLAEYMAALYLVSEYGADEEKWKEFLKHADALSQKREPVEIRGFLLALRDACSANETVPHWLEPELLERAHYDIPAQAESRRARRLRFSMRRFEKGDESEKQDALSNIEAGGYIDAEAELRIAQVAKSGEMPLRARALEVLGQLECRSDAAREAFVMALQDRDVDLRKVAVRSSVITGPSIDRRAAAIMPLARDENAEVRELVATELGRIESPSAESELSRLLGDSVHAVQLAAALALTEVAPGAKSVSQLAQIIRDADDLGYRTNQFGKYPEALEVLARRLDDPASDFRVACLQLLVNAVKGQPPSSISERVKPLLGDDDPSVSIWAAVALWRWDIATPDAQSLVRKLAGSENEDVRRTALGLLAQMEPDQEARELLFRSLKDPSQKVRVSVAVGMLRLNEKVEQALEIFWEMAGSSRAQDRYDLTVAIKRLQKISNETIDEILIKLVGDGHDKVRSAAAECILDRKELRPLQALKERSTDEARTMRVHAAKAFALINLSDERGLAPLRRMFHDPSFMVQLEAAKSYWKLTGNAAEVLPILYQFQWAEFFWSRSEAFDVLTEIATVGQGDFKLIKLGLEDGEQHTRHSAIKALLASPAIDDDIEKSVARLLDDSYAFVRSSAVEFLARTGHFTRDVRKKIAELATDRNYFVRAAAVSALGEIDTPTEAEIGVIIRGTRDEHEHVVGKAAQALGAAPASDEAVAASVQLLKSDDLLVDLWAEESLGKIVTKGGSEVLERLASTIDDSTPPDVSLRVATVIEKVTGALPESFLPLIAKALSDDKPASRRRAAEILGKSGATDPAVLSGLQSALTDKEAPVRRAAMFALQRLAPDLPNLSESASRLIESDDASLRVSGAIVLAAHGVEAGRNQVREILRGQDAELCRTTLALLGDMPSATADFREDLESLLTNEDARIRTSAASLLLEGPSADDAIQALSQLLIEGKSVAGVLRKVGKRAAAAIPALLKSVELGDEAAIALLAEVAPASVSMPSLQQALLQTKPGVRAAAAQAVATIGQAPGEVMTRLKELSRDPDQDVRMSARAAIKRFASSASP